MNKILLINRIDPQDYSSTRGGKTFFHDWWYGSAFNRE